jgi:hypothetical protein
MRSKVAAVIAIIILVSPLSCLAQRWETILGSGQAIDWSNSGVGDIPARTINCASLASSATLEQINAALKTCRNGETVYLAAGTYLINGTIHIPSNVTLRGAGSDLTILNANGTSGGYVVSLGSGSVAYNPVKIANGASAGSTSIVVSDASGITVGEYLVISETNNSSYVSSLGSEGNCNWCDGGWTNAGSLARGQIVAVTGVKGTTIHKFTYIRPI